MQFITTLAALFFASATTASLTERPFAFVKRENGSKSWVGGSIGCFGTAGDLVEAEITEGYEATFYSDYSCKGDVIGPYECFVEFECPVNVKSIKLEKAIY
jgi:hypothetical protein